MDLRCPDYAKIDFAYRDHCRRYRRHVESMPIPLTCQECGGSGGWREIIDPEIGGPWFDCGCCRGTGLVTAWDRAQWLRWKAQEKREREAA